MFYNRKPPFDAVRTRRRFSSSRALGSTLPATQWSSTIHLHEWVHNWVQSLRQLKCKQQKVESSWNVMAHCDARDGKWRRNWWMECVASTLHTTSEHGVSSIITADAHTSAASSRVNWRPRRFKGTRPFRQKTKSGFCVCPITFQLASSWRRIMKYTVPLPSS
jgi:hypothetical protein